MLVESVSSKRDVVTFRTNRAGTCQRHVASRRGVPRMTRALLLIGAFAMAATLAVRVRAHCEGLRQARRPQEEGRLR